MAYRIMAIVALSPSGSSLSHLIKLFLWADPDAEGVAAGVGVVAFGAGD